VAATKDDTEAVRVALAEVVERARLRRWVRKVAGKGRLMARTRSRFAIIDTSVYPATCTSMR